MLYRTTWFVFMSHLRVVRKTLISGAPVRAKTSHPTLRDAYCAREIEKNASYEGHYAISYPAAPLRVETYASTRCWASGAFGMSMRTKPSFRKQQPGASLPVY